MVHMEQINGEIYEKLVSKLAEDEFMEQDFISGPLYS